MRTRFAALALLSLIFPLMVSAEEGVEKHAEEAKKTDSAHAEKLPLGPAKRYSGSTPIDMSNGGLGSNGTYGDPNPEYEKMAAGPYLSPGLLATPYSYENKKAFVHAVQNRLKFFEEAVVNLREVSPTWKEGQDHARQALEKIDPLLAKAKDALKQAQSAGSSEWSGAEQNARAAFIALYGTYQSLNTARAQAPTAQ